MSGISLEIGWLCGFIRVIPASTARPAQMRQAARSSAALAQPAAAAAAVAAARVRGEAANDSR